MPRRRPLRILGITLLLLSLLLCLASLHLWANSGDIDTNHTWSQGRRSVQVAARKGLLRVMIAGPWPDDSRTRIATSLLLTHKGRIDVRARIDGITQSLLAQRDALARRVAASANSPTASELQKLHDAETLNAWNGFLRSWSDVLITEQRPRVRQVLGVTVERSTCRLPERNNDTHQIRFEAPVPLLTISVPCWMPVVLFGALPALALTRSLARSAVVRSRLRHNLCPACGYDLRASPDRCPECGAPPRTPEPRD